MPGAGAPPGHPAGHPAGPGLSPVHRHPLQSPQHTVCMYGSCGDAVYTKIRGKEESMAPDWIPLHTLYQERRLYQYYQQLELELRRYEGTDPGPDLPLDLGVDLGLGLSRNYRFPRTHGEHRAHTLQHGQRQDWL
ncbi:hypothetical protein FOCC_FOCC001149 [Frankliniella occidentalis]|nr:hypothetical protein FOCC_FOCC001149 [Frankliniella occidentalis]